MAEQQNQGRAQTQEDINHLLKVRREKLAQLKEEGKDPFQITKYDVTVHSTDVKEDYARWEGKEVSLAGRMMSKRVSGKGFLLQCPGSEREYPVLCGQRQYRRGVLQGV